MPTLIYKPIFYEEELFLVSSSESGGLKLTQWSTKTQKEDVTTIKTPEETKSVRLALLPVITRKVVFVQIAEMDGAEENITECLIAVERHGEN